MTQRDIPHNVDDLVKVNDWHSIFNDPFFIKHWHLVRYYFSNIKNYF